jgi:ABC-type glutathione transport system ATPase component/ABC-type dipeptide/oligopeptide/nickel transport system permease subunit
VGNSIERILGTRKAAVGAAIALAFIALAIVGPWLISDATDIVGAPRLPPSASHWFGIDGQGQDVLARAVVGARSTLFVAFGVGISVTLIGAAVGVTGGYFGGRVDAVLAVLTNVFLVIPGLPLAIVLAAYLPSGPWSLAMILTLTGWAWNARQFRSQALSLASRDFVAAAKIAGEPHTAIVFREILPNMASLVASAMIGATIYALGAQVGLEFLGLGDVGAVTWGTNLYWAANNAALITGTWWEFAPTGFAIALVGFSLVLINFAIDEVNNPRLIATPDNKSNNGTSRVRPRSGPAPSQGQALVLRKLTIRYPGAARNTVDNVDLEVHQGQLLGLAGVSGCGKTTIGKALLGLLPAGTTIEGEIWVDGQLINELDPEALRRFRWQRASMVFQSALSVLNPVATVRQQIADTLAAHGRFDFEDRALELMTLVELEAATLDRYPHELSGGMRQRVVIAIALALRPHLIIMDEPTTALDVVVERQILERVLALKSELSVAVLFISHDVRLMLHIADIVAVMHAGTIVEIGPAAKLRSDAEHAETRSLLSDDIYSRPIQPSQTRVDRSDQTPPVLRVRGIRKSYAASRLRTLAVRDINFEVHAGEIVALVGPSGSGKSTLARIIARLIDADAGSLELQGRDAMQVPLRDYRSRVQMIFQDPFASLNPVHRVGYQVDRVLRRLGHVGADQLELKRNELLESIGLELALAQRFPHQLSGGQRQRFAVARVLAARPQLIIADEPTSMLDASIRAELLSLLRGLSRDRGVAILLITHDLASAARYSDRALVLEAGQIVESGAADEMFVRPTHPCTQRLALSAAFAGRDSGTVPSQVSAT